MPRTYTDTELEVRITPGGASPAGEIRLISGALTGRCGSLRPIREVLVEAMERMAGFR